MIHIRQAANGEFYVTVSAPNGEILSTSETFKKKQSAWKNIKAMAKSFYASFILKVCDETTEKSNYFFFDPKVDVVTKMKQ